MNRTALLICFAVASAFAAAVLPRFAGQVAGTLIGKTLSSSETVSKPEETYTGRTGARAYDFRCGYTPAELTANGMSAPARQNCPANAPAFSTVALH